MSIGIFTFGLVESSGKNIPELIFNYESFHPFWHIPNHFPFRCVYIVITKKEVIFTTESITKECAEQLYNEYSVFVYKIALFLTKSRAIAEDVTQETFIQLFKKYHLYNLNKPIEPWIYKITINIPSQYLQKTQMA